MKNLRAITNEERKSINEYFAEMESGWQLENDIEVIVTDSIESVAQYLGHNIDGLSYEEIENLVDVRHVWYDGENTCNYYIIVQ